MNQPKHRKTVKHYEESRQLHELTFSCYQRKPLLTNDRWRGILARSIDQACEDENFQLIAFVFMPEHVHLLVLPDSQQSKVSRFLARVKQPTSKQIRDILEQNNSKLLNDMTVQERPGKHCFRFWQPGPGYDRNIYSADAIEASIHYLHLNPVRRELCSRASDYRWSSCRFYQDNKIDTELPKITSADPLWIDKSGSQMEW